MNLIICTTPFQMLIAEKIIHYYPNRKFHLFVITHNYNDKYIYYYNRLRGFCENSSYIKLLPQGRSKIYTLLDLIYLRVYSFFLPKYDTIFLANVEDIWIQTFLSRYINTSNICTYDDGTANIIYSSYLYKEKSYGFINRFCFKLIGKKFTLTIFRNVSKLHFTIYKFKRNIIEKTQYIELYSKPNSAELSIDNREEICIFLGQPIYQFDRKLYDTIPKFIRKYNIENYFCHPREDILNLKLPDINFIKTEFIFEDYIIRMINENNYKFKVYTFFSGAILNIVNFPNVEVYAIKSQSIPESVNSIYNIFQDSGVNVIEEE
ncbi:MAG: glycosyltransferase family 52 [[Pasteurella] mairii]|uniref:CMP-N-acetylneuraminate-beta-galactosamide-alpha-2,3-sialyltransferase n=1 Tax=[Pasteurella] mairii TaxID=757 RepID=A0A379B2D4_9PAST|nr:glycosyltransferase family 52 [[Pasteurella] mairii]SUB32757.1 CMP-N-acetylneuraminate-beta-galactosamide-alpha-2,3-sialyltransferase [[Pasteurella] mairii]